MRKFNTCSLSNAYLCDEVDAKADIFSLRGYAYEQKAFTYKKDMAILVVKAIENYQAAYKLTHNIKYKEYEEEIIDKFNRKGVTKENIFKASTQ